MSVPLVASVARPTATTAARAPLRVNFASTRHSELFKQSPTSAHASTGSLILPQSRTRSNAFQPNIGSHRRTFTAATIHRIARPSSCLQAQARTLPESPASKQTLQTNPHIYAHPHPAPSNADEAKLYILSYLPKVTPATLCLAIGSTHGLPPTPATLIENKEFLSLLETLVREHATHDPAVQAQAKLFASSGGSGLGSGGAMFLPASSSASTRRKKNNSSRGGQKSTAASTANTTGSSGAGGTGGTSTVSSRNTQGGVGGAGVGGWLHVSDTRNPPDWGRIPYTEDILGSLQVDASGGFVGPDGNFQWSGTYRPVTNEGVLGLTDFMRAKLVEKLEELEEKILAEA